MNLYGMKVIVNPELEKPKIKISDHVLISDKFREEFQIWLNEMFGFKHEVIYNGNMIIVGPHTFNKLKSDANNTLTQNFT